MTYAFPPQPIPTLPIIGTSKLFPVNHIYCVGRNYAEHAREMGHDPQREPPFFFQKSPDNLRTDGIFPYPPLSKDVHFEIELVVALKSGGSNIAPEAANSHIFGYAVGLDMTRRDLQAEAKKQGRPWDVAKAFAHSAPCTGIVLVGHCGILTKGHIWLDVNGVRRQTGVLEQMIWDVPHQVAYLSTLFELKPGDLIFTGTPAGVGAINRGDILRGHVDSLAELEVRVV